MRVKVNDKSEGLITILEVMCVELPENESYFRVWDYQDNAADILTESASIAAESVERLFERSYVEVDATFRWCDHDE